jgi:cell division protein FtsZ
MRTAEAGITELQAAVDTLIVIPNQNLFRVATEKTTFADAFAMADQVLYSGVACITDLMVKEGLINLDFADVRAIMRGMGKAMMGTGEASGEKRANRAAEAAIANPLLDDVSMKGARGLLISITGGNDLTLYELDEAATRIREEVDSDANIILGATFDESLDGIIRVSVVATGIEPALITASAQGNPEIAQTEQRIAEVAERLRAEARARVAQAPAPTFRPAGGEQPAAQQPVAPVVRPATVDPVAAAEPIRAEMPAAPPVRDEVVLTQTQARAATYEPAPMQAPEPVAAPIAGPYLPPRPAVPVARAPRMPQIQDLPMPAQAQLRVHRGEEAIEPPADSKRMTLLRRLATVGFGGRREEAEAAPPAPVRAPAPAPHPDQAKRPVPAPAPQYRPAQGSLDPQGRVAPQARMMDDDQLEIPAFLRRQAN